MSNDPTLFLGLGFADAIVARTVGGRVIDAVIQDLAYIGYDDVGQCERDDTVHARHPR